MFQTFEATTSPDQGPPRLAELRKILAQQGFDAFIIPRADAFQGEYVAPCDARLEWLTGFTGSAGFAIVTAEQAGVFIDGRYRVQVKDQVSLTHFTPVHWPETKPAEWLRENMPDGVVAYDPWLFTKSQIDNIKKGLQGSDLKLEPSINLIDLIWKDRPARPDNKVEPHPLELSGQRSPDKREAIATVLRDAGQKCAILTLPDSICWLLNIRGTDIPRNPIVQCNAIIYSDARVDLFIDPSRVADLGPDDSISVHAPETFVDIVTKSEGPIRIDPTSAPIVLSQAIEEKNGAKIDYADDPCSLPKACKNATEIEGARAAHLRDAVAVIEFLTWLDAQHPGQFTEIDAVTSLEGFRVKTNALKDISFETISGAGANGAIVHYRVTKDTNRTVNEGELLLVDSGGQYVDGTTDITRTIAIGTPTADQKHAFTRVLQGMIAVSQTRFPKGLSGRDIDPLARAPLWRDGMDYDHGTGHGVGSYLSVHEGPQRISRLSEVPLQPGMILSNEPGYYKEGAFGIRIENLIVVQDAEPLGDRRDHLSFETLTWVPIDRRLIDKSLLSPDEISWLNTYHATIRDKVNVSGPAANWLAQATEPL